MMEDNTLYTIIVHSENISGILNQVAAVFTRLQVNIESLNVSASSMKNVHKFTITCKTTARNIDKILKQINKKMDVINASCYTDDEIFQSEIAPWIRRITCLSVVTARSCTSEKQSSLSRIENLSFRFSSAAS